MALNFARATESPDAERALVQLRRTVASLKAELEGERQERLRREEQVKDLERAAVSAAAAQKRAREEIRRLQEAEKRARDFALAIEKELHKRTEQLQAARELMRKMEEDQEQLKARLSKARETAATAGPRRAPGGKPSTVATGDAGAFNGELTALQETLSEIRRQLEAEPPRE